MITRSNPPGLHQPPGYHHVTVVEPGGLVFLAGQCPLDESGEVVGPDDLVAQCAQVAANIDLALASVGADAADVVRSVIYVASSEPGDLALTWSALQASVVGVAFTSASTLLGVARLGFPGQLVEVDITAVIPQIA